VLRNATVHVLGACSKWCSHREAYLTAFGSVLSAQPLTRCLLSCQPGDPAFQAAVDFAAAVDKAEFIFWGSAT
jgi:hypothetical protein